MNAHKITALNCGKRFFNVTAQADGAAAGVARRDDLAGDGQAVQRGVHSAVVGHGAGEFAPRRIGDLAGQQVGGGGVGVGGGDVVRRDGLHRHRRQHLARRGLDGLLGGGGGDGLAFRRDGHRTAAAVAALRDGVAGGGRVQHLGDGAVVGHGTGLDGAGAVHKDLARQQVGFGGSDRGHVLIGIGDSLHRHVGQTVVPLIGGGLLGFLGGGDGLALQGVAAAPRYAGHRAGAVVVALGDGVGLALLDLRRHRPLIDDGVKVGGQFIQLFGAGGQAQFHRLGPQGVAGGLDAGDFGLNAHKNLLRS